MSAADVLVVGAAGEVGREVVRALLERGTAVRALVRASAIAQHPDVEPVPGDLGDPASLARALIGVRAAFFMTPHHADEERMGTSFVEACEHAGVARLVFSGAAHPIARSLWLQALIDAGVGFIGPHYRPKLRVERRVRRTRPEPVILLPSNFYQNDALHLDDLRDGLYPQPLGRRGMNRVDCRDIGDAAARALLGELPAGVYPLVGPDDWTGEGCAAVWQDVLGVPVRYAGDDIDAWRARIGDRMAQQRREDFAKTYQVIQRHGYRANPREHARTEHALGRPATPYPAYVRTVAATPGC